MKSHKLKSYLFGLLLLFFCISVAGAYEIGRCKVKINPDGPMLRFAWLYYQDSSGQRKVTSTLPMQLFQQRAQIKGIYRDITICGGHTHSCDTHPSTRVQNSDGTTTHTDGILSGDTKLVTMDNRQDHVVFERKADGTWRYTLKISAEHPSNNLEQEGIIANKPGQTNQCGIISYPNKDVPLKVALKYINNSSTDLVNYKHGDCDNGRSCTLPPEVIKFP